MKKILLKLIYYALKKNIKDIIQGKIYYCIDNCIKLDYKNFSLHVSTTNLPALNLYRKLGFEAKFFIEKYYSDEKPEDSNAYYMELNI